VHTHFNVWERIEHYGVGVETGGNRLAGGWTPNEDVAFHAVSGRRQDRFKRIGHVAECGCGYSLAARPVYIEVGRFDAATRPNSMALGAFGGQSQFGCDRFPDLDTGPIRLRSQVIGCLLSGLSTSDRAKTRAKHFSVNSDCIVDFNPHWALPLFLNGAPPEPYEYETFATTPSQGVAGQSCI
jgi:hypothetical protein